MDEGYEKGAYRGEIRIVVNMRKCLVLLVIREM